MKSSWTIRELGIFSVKDFTFGVDAGQIQELVQKKQLDFLTTPTDQSSFAIVYYHQKPIPVFNLVHKLRIGGNHATEALPSLLTFMTFYRDNWLLACAVDVIENFISVAVRSLKPVPELIVMAAPQICVWGFYELSGNLIPLIDLERVITDQDLLQYQARINKHSLKTRASIT